MAQKRKRKKNKKRLFWILMLILLVAAAVVVYFVWDGYFKGKDGDKKESSQEVERVEERRESEDRSEDTRREEEHGRLEDEAEDGKEIVQYDGENPNKAESISGVVTYAGVSGERLMIRVNIDQFLDGGECILNLMRNGSTIYNDTAKVVGNVATATCEGFDVPVNGMGGGTTDIIITVNSGERTGTIVGKVEL